MVLLCGPHIQGAQGISCGRHLANHEVEVILFLPNFVKMQESVTSEVNLYGRTSSKQVASVQGKRAFTVDDQILVYSTFRDNDEMDQVGRVGQFLTEYLNEH